MIPKKLILPILISALFISILVCFGFNKNDISETEENYKWKLTFEDNFDSYDNSKWINHFERGNRTIWSNKELQWYKDENVKVENGILNLIAKKENIYGKDNESEKNFEYTSGMICGSKSFEQAYGKWEARVKFPFSKGFWPAFWLVPKQTPSLPEIDIFEYFGIEENKIWSNHHWGLDYPNWGGAYKDKTDPFYYQEGKETIGDFSDNWMIWSFEWFPNKIVWKLDNNAVFESTKGIPTAPLYILANVAVKDFP